MISWIQLFLKVWKTLPCSNLNVPSHGAWSRYIIRCLRSNKCLSFSVISLVTKGWFRFTVLVCSCSRVMQDYHSLITTLLSFLLVLHAHSVSLVGQRLEKHLTFKRQWNDNSWKNVPCVASVAVTQSHCILECCCWEMKFFSRIDSWFNIPDAVVSWFRM